MVSAQTYLPAPSGRVQQAVLTALLDEGAATVNVLRAQIDAERSTINNSITLLVQRGLVQLTPDGMAQRELGDSSRCYSLTQAGTKVASMIFNKTQGSEA
jgi:DNA-binding MarR family transcriptional regulator